MLLQLCHGALPLTSPFPHLSVSQKENPLISEGASYYAPAFAMAFALATIIALMETSLTNALLRQFQYLSMRSNLCHHRSCDKRFGH